jgi:DNA-binding SARP family transcriptional activator
MAPIRIELLGRLRFTFGRELIATVNTKRLQSLLAALVLNGGLAQSREHLAGLLWPESSDSQSRTNLRQLLHHLRRSLPAECALLAVDNHTVRWISDTSCTVDVIEFENALVRAAQAERNGDSKTAREALLDAVRLYQDDLLPDLHDDWLHLKREELRQRISEVFARLSTLLELEGDLPESIRYATKLVTFDALSEASYQRLIRLQSRNNDRSSALRVYHQCVRTLQRELGVGPSRETEELRAHVLGSDQAEPIPPESPPFAMDLPLPMVGRVTEWKRLLGCLQHVTGGGAHFALITGEPGIGKSRLVDELFEHCSRDPAIACARARCYLAQGQLAYGPVAEWLRAKPIRSTRPLLPKPQLVELARVLPEILIKNADITSPVPLTESWQRRHLYEALNAAFRKGPKPLLLVIDDLHWCDQDSIEWLHSFFRSRASARTLVLGTARPEEMGRDHPLLTLVSELNQSAQLSEIPIAPLSEAEAGELAGHVSKRNCDPAFLSSLYKTTKGNPLFVVESVRASLEDQPFKGSTPPRVQAVIAARLAKLSPAAYELAGFIAAIGRPFSIDLLSKATDWDEDNLSRTLEELWQRRIIGGQGTPDYDYTHDLLREVAYSELSPMRRRSLHLRIARALEELHESNLERVSGWLAAHYESAGVSEKAVRQYQTAASVAKNRFAYAEAADLLRKGLRLSRELPDSTEREKMELELLVRLGPLLVAIQGYSAPEVGESYERGLLLSRRTGERNHLFSLISGACIYRIVSGRLEESRLLAQDSVEEARREGSSSASLAAHFLLGCSLFHLGRLAESLEQMELALQASGDRSHPALALFAGPDVGMFCLSYLSHLHWHLGPVDLASRKSNEAVELAREISHPFSLAIALDYAALFDAFRGDARSVLARTAESSVICRTYGFTYYLAWAEILAGWANVVQGDAAGGLVQLRRGIEDLKATGAEVRLPFYHGLLAEACFLSGQVAEAFANVATAFAFQSKNAEIWSAPGLHRLLGDLLIRKGEASEAQVSYARAIESARQTGACEFERRIPVVLGT